MADSSITLEQAIAHRDVWLAASQAIALGQEYSHQNGPVVRKLVRADLPEVTKMLEYWERRVKALDPKRNRRVRFGVPE